MAIPNLEKFTKYSHCLPATGTWPKSVHVFDERSGQAIRAALVTGRPLLVRGEPGTGKSQLARAAAKVLSRKFLSHVVDAHTEIQDLWYRFDAVSRLGHAQTLGASGEQRPAEEVEKMLDPSRFVSPGILWWAFGWGDASEQKVEHPFFLPDLDDPGDADKGVVLLLDEIDKADSDLPNSLLETLDNGRFTVPWLKKTVGVGREDNNRPLVVITTNEDRQLPAAFVRRCLVLELWLPEGEALVHYLKERATVHYPKKNGESCGMEMHRDENGHLEADCRFDEDVLTETANQLAGDRERAVSLGVTPPGQAEFLDMLRILDELAPGNRDRQLKLLATIKDFALKKYPTMQKPSIKDMDRDSERLQ